jgi:hypothetical protein
MITSAPTQEKKRRRLARLQQAWEIACKPWTILAGVIAVGVVTGYCTILIHNHIAGIG